MSQAMGWKAPRVEAAATTDGLPLAPSMDGALVNASVPRQATLVDRRVLLISALAVILGGVAAGIARLLTALIGLVTNLAYYGHVSTTFASPAGNHLGLWAVAVPVLGGVIVGIMARYGSQAIRGHGIPEAMEQVLTNQSRIAPRVTFLKPLSAAIAIGTGGPFGAEGPIIATGGALGSVLGQVLRTSAVERKTLLAAGAAAGMAATFGTPVAAVVLAMELLLFEFRPRSLIPVALAAATATGVRYALLGAGPAFVMPAIAEPGGQALAFYCVLGAGVGLISVGVTRILYWIEDMFEHLPLHWMWWPALGGLAVGLVGLISPRTLGVGYDNIEGILGGQIVGTLLISLCLFKFLSWSIALGSGTSGGTLAPLFTIGAGVGAVAGRVAVELMPSAGIDPRVAALVGMAAIFAGASRAMLASVIFAFETTRQTNGLLPLLGGCTMAYLLSCVFMKHTIMTEKIARRGKRVPAEYVADFLEQMPLAEVALKEVVCLRANQTVEQTLRWLEGERDHQGYPVLDERDRLVGVVTRRDLTRSEAGAETPVRQLIRRAPVVVFDDGTLRDAEDQMVRERVGRLPVVSREEPWRVVGIITRSDLLAAHSARLDSTNRKERSIRIGAGSPVRSA